MLLRTSLVASRRVHSLGRGLVARPRCRCFATEPLKPPGPPPPPSPQRPGAPDAETVRKLGESARFQQKVWDTWVPEQGIHFGTRKFWILAGIVGALHAINTYRDARKQADPDLPAGALRRLPGGKLLMEDGSTAREERETGHEHKLHKYKEVGEDELVLDRLWRFVKEAV